MIIIPRIIDGEKSNLAGGNVRKIRLEKKLSRQILSARPETIVVYICRGSISRIEDFFKEEALPNGKEEMRTALS